MTPAQLRKSLARLYGKDLSRWRLCVHFAEDVGMHPDAVQRWLTGVNGVHPLVPFAIEALEKRKAAGH